MDKDSFKQAVEKAVAEDKQIAVETIGYDLRNLNRDLIILASHFSDDEFFMFVIYEHYKFNEFLIEQFKKMSDSQEAKING